MIVFVRAPPSPPSQHSQITALFSSASLLPKNTPRDIFSTHSAVFRTFPEGPNLAHRDTHTHTHTHTHQNHCCLLFSFLSKQSLRGVCFTFLTIPPTTKCVGHHCTFGFGRNTDGIGTVFFPGDQVRPTRPTTTTTAHPKVCVGLCWFLCTLHTLLPALMRPEMLYAN